MRFRYVLSLVMLPLSLSAGIIHVIGDSHGHELNGIESNVFHPIGAITMHRIGRDGLNILNFKTLNIQEKDTVVLCFGEIDVRCHIGKQRDVAKRDLEEIIDTLATNYFQTILLNRALYTNISIIVYTVTPPANGASTAEYPMYGELGDRVAIAKKLNQKIREIAASKGIKVLDVYDDYSDQNGVLKRELSDGDVHILPSCNQKIREKLLLLI